MRYRSGLRRADRSVCIAQLSRCSLLARASVITLAATILSVTLAAPAEASLRTIAHWKVTISGSVRHDWTLLDPTPCNPSGSGSVTAHFASTRPGRITIADNGYGPGNFSWDQRFHVHGTITGLDARSQNPPAPGDSQCQNSEPVPDTHACGTRRLNDALSVEAPLHGRYRLYDSGNFGNALTPPDGGTDCELGGFVSFATIAHGPSPDAQALPLPGYPTDARLASRHGTIVVSAFQHRRFVATAETTRRVRIVFTRVGAH
jgi:hypothetical protein